MKINEIYHWWGKFLGTTEGAIDLVDYFKNRKYEPFPLHKVLEELNLLPALQNKTLKSNDANLFYCIDPSCKTTNDQHVSLDIGIDVLLNLAYIVAESKASDGVTLAELGVKNDDFKIQFDTTSEDLYLICDEFEQFYDEPEEYNIAELVDEDTLYQLAEIAHDLIECLL